MSQAMNEENVDSFSMGCGRIRSISLSFQRSSSMSGGIGAAT
jgi:hypothetical protein